jgi:hypothetical protein
MNAQEAALIAIAERLESLGIPYMVIGGMANVVWGEPRTTLDVNVTIWVDEGDIDSLPGRLADHFILLPDNPMDRDYLDPRLQELAEALERPDIWRNYERWLHRR